MGTLTTRMGLTKPTPGVDTGWGVTLNADFDTLDALAGWNNVSYAVSTPLVAGIGPTLVEVTATPVTLTLPDANAAVNLNTVFFIVKTSAPAGSVTLNTTGGQLMSGASSGSVAVTAQWGYIALQSDGSNWIIIADHRDGVTGSGAIALATSAVLTTPNIGTATATAIIGLTAPVTPNTFGGTTIGTAALPFSGIYIGAAATNNTHITGAVTGARTLTLPDADSNTVRPSSAPANQFATGIASTGIIAYAQPSAANLSNGVTGSGAVVLAISPTLTGTVGLPIVTLTGKVTNYDSIATVSGGVPAEYATVDVTFNDNIAPTTLYTVPASGAGMYRVSAYIIITTPDGVSSTLPKVVITWEDADNTVSQSFDLTAELAGTISPVVYDSTTTFAQGTMVLSAFAQLSPPLTSLIQYSTVGYASATPNFMVYALHIKLEAL